MIEHKFKISPDSRGNYPDTVDDRFYIMCYMSIAMMGAALACFVMSTVFERKEEKEELEKKTKAYKRYGSIFMDEI